MLQFGVVCVLSAAEPNGLSYTLTDKAETPGPGRKPVVA